MRILYIEDNLLLVQIVKKTLATLHTIDSAQTGHIGIKNAVSGEYDIILLDLLLPDIDGLEVCRELRRRKIGAPILVITAQKDPKLSTRLLSMGADDFLTKPFSNDILQARIAALLRRGKNLCTERIVRVCDLTVNITRRQVTRCGVTIALRRKEFDILEYLVANCGHTLTRSRIMDHVWESGKESWDTTVDVHIKHLRDKIDRPFGKALIKTMYGIGYMVDDTQ